MHCPFAASTEISPSSKFHHTTKKFGHGFAKNASDAAIKSLRAGLDIELTCCGAAQVYPTLVQSVKDGRIDSKYVDRALLNTLPFRFQLGQLDEHANNPYSKLNGHNVSTPAMIEQAGKTARRAIVLLKNKDKTLPLSASDLQGKTVCVIGPNANDKLNQMGGYVQQVGVIQ